MKHILRGGVTAIRQREIALGGKTRHFWKELFLEED